MRDDELQQVVASRRTVAARNDFEAVLLTAPHGANVNHPVDDPCSASVAQRVAPLVRSELHLRCDCFVAEVSRSLGDQNRFLGLMGVSDLRPKLTAHLKAAKKRRGTPALDKVLHLDVHTFTNTDDDLHDLGWGTGINLITLHGDGHHKRLARRFALHLDEALEGRLHPTNVVTMDRRATSLDDDDANAMIEWTLHHGAQPLLVEIPTVQTGINQYALPETCAEDTVARAIVHAISRLQRE